MRIVGALLVGCIACAIAQVHLKTKLLYRFTDGENGNQPLDDTWLTVGLSGLIAVDMFNERNGSIIPELGQLGDCDVFFDDTMFDTASTSVGAMTAYLAQPQDIIVGAPRTASSEPVALVGGIQQVPQMSFWSTAPSFDDKFYNPYFMRTIPSDSAIGESIVAYFLDNDFRAVHVIYIDDSYGSAYARSLSLLADQNGIRVSTVGFIGGSASSMNDALTIVQNSRLRIILLVAFETDATYIMSSAHERGMVNDEYLWIYADAVSEGWIAGFPEPSWIDGHLRLLSIGGTSTNPLWNAYKDYLRSIPDLDARYSHRLPGDVTCPDDLLETTEISDVSTFSFDAVVALGLGACAARAATGGVAPAAILNHTYQVAFDGLSGRVEFDEFGSRKASTGNFMLQNLRMTSDGAMSLVTLGSWDSSAGSWQLTEQPIYPSGSTVPPSFVAIPDEERNFLGEIVNVGYVLFSVHAAACIGFAAWVIYNRETKVVKRAQPVFLLMIIFGTLISSSTMIPLSLADDEDADLEQESEHVYVSGELDSVCQAIPWLYCIGYITTFSALLAKIKRIAAVFINPTMKRITIQPIDALRVAVPIFAAEIVLLLCWQIIDPLRWERRALSSDSFGNPEESVGRCVNSHPWAFIAPILLVHLLGTAYALRLAYKVKDVPTDFQEGKWISVALFCNFQILLLSVPLFILVDEDPRASYLLRCDIIFLNDFSALCLIIVPKIIKLWLRLQEGAEHGDVPTVQGLQIGTSGNSGSDRPQSTRKFGGDPEDAGYTHLIGGPRQPYQRFNGGLWFLCRFECVPCILCNRFLCLLSGGIRFGFVISPVLTRSCFEWLCVLLRFMNCFHTRACFAFLFVLVAGTDVCRHLPSVPVFWTIRELH